MNASNIISAALVAVGYAGWGIVAKRSQINGGWVGVIVMAMTAIVVVSLSVPQLRAGFPDSKAALWLVAAGIINGVAVFIFSSRVSDSAVPTAAFMALVFMFVVIAAPCFDRILNHVTPSPNQFVGLALAIGAIYFLSK